MILFQFHLLYNLGDKDELEVKLVHQVQVLLQNF
jgi:hypothetical protein